MDNYSKLICAQCFTKQKTCCTLDPPLTIRDIERIKSLGNTFESFARLDEWKKEDYEGEEDWWINSMIKVNDKTFKITLKKKENGNCIFLDEKKGCTLGSNRPSACKIFPFWVENDKVVYDESLEDFCYMRKQNINVENGLNLLAETEKKIKEYYNEIKDDCIKNKDKHKELAISLIK